MAGGRRRTVLSDNEDDMIREEEEEIEREEPRDGEDVDADVEEEDYEEGKDEYEKDGFIVDDVEDEEERRKKRKKKRKRRESEMTYVLDEEDYELLRDNNVSFHRHNDPGRKLKRLKKAGRDNEQGEPFDEGPHPEDVVEEEEQPEEDDVNVSNIEDFIVNEGVYQDGAPVRLRKKVPGVSSSALQEAFDIFGDVDDILERRKKDLGKSSTFDNFGGRNKKMVEDEFEPFILKGKYMTQRDDEVRDIDLPERIQLLEQSIGPARTDDLSLEEEGAWIHDQLITNYKSLLVQNPNVLEASELSTKLKEDILRLLQLIHVDKFDIPFIATYRKESCPTLLKDLELDEKIGNVEDTRSLKQHKVLWVIKDLVEKCLLLQKRKRSLESYYNKCFEGESQQICSEKRLNLNQKIFESIMKSLKTAESEREVDDVNLKFNLHFPRGEIGVEHGQIKRPNRKSYYSIYSKAGLWEVANRIGVNSERLGLFVTLEEMGHCLEDPKETPEDVASSFICEMFENPQDVLRAARHMAAAEISCEPRIRKHVRCIFMSHTVVSTRPTLAGNSVIDSFHQFVGIKWLQNKPVGEFNDAQWLLIQKSEGEKLIHVTVKLPQYRLDNLLNEFTEYYLSDGVSASAKLWNEQRNLILQDAFFNFLLPSIKKEVRSLLTSRAKNWLLMEYRTHLWNKVSVASFQHKENDSADGEAVPKVMACCWSLGNPGTTFVMLDSSGELLDVLHTGSLSSQSQNANDQQHKENDRQHVLKFMTDHQPHVCVLGAANLSCTKLKAELYEIIFKMVEEYPREIGQDMDELNIVYGDECLPRLYENSRVSLDQLPKQPGIVRRAVALGRYLQNPLAIVATLCGPEREILSWKLGSSEHFLTPDEKYEMVEQVMVDVTNQVGIDINLAASHEWLFSPLQFVSGLGPRKAAALQKAVVRKRIITTRKHFFEKFMNRKVFINAVGFLRICRSGVAKSSQYLDVLDDSRIHPESYELAKHMAMDVYKMDAQEEANDDDNAFEMAVEHVRERPYFLKAFDIDKYATSVEERCNVFNKRDTLEDIKMELMQGFCDLRTPYREPDQNEEFYMISGESKDTLSEGRIVQVTVRGIQRERASCVLESGLSGLLMVEDYSDELRPKDLSVLLNKGDILTCKIKSIQMNRYQVYLTCKESELKGAGCQNSQNLDPYYRSDENSLPCEQVKAPKRKELTQKHSKRRMIVHPCFQDMTADEAIKFLSDKEAGESMIRPSSIGRPFLTLTLKVYDGVYAHKDIIEVGKDHNEKVLKIGKDTFEDLDEVMGRYVDPLVAHLKAMLSYRKFKRGSKQELDNLLRMEKLQNPTMIVYCFGISHEHPGTFILSYIRSTLRHEYIGMNPKGFKFRNQNFEDIDKLVAYFKRHITDLQHNLMPSDQGEGSSRVASIGVGVSESNDDIGRGQGNFDS